MHKGMVRVSGALNDTNQCIVLTFLSCIALIENNNYVDFRALETLRKSLPLTIAQMKVLLLLSNCITPKWTPHPQGHHRHSFLSKFSGSVRPKWHPDLVYFLHTLANTLT